MSISECPGGDKNFFFNIIVLVFKSSYFSYLQVKLPNLHVVMHPPRYPPPASRQLPPRSLSLAQFLPKHKPHRTLARPSSTLLCPLAMAIPACPTMLACQVFLVPSSTAQPSSCHLPQPSSMHSTSTKLVTADTPMLQVSIHDKGLVKPGRLGSVIITLLFIKENFLYDRCIRSCF